MNKSCIIPSTVAIITILATYIILHNALLFMQNPTPPTSYSIEDNIILVVTSIILLMAGWLLWKMPR